MKAQTFEEYFKLPPFSVKKYIEKQEAELKKNEEDRKKRMANSRKK
jgi:hypothetical protein